MLRKSQAGLLACSVDDDLNPVRAKIESAAYDLKVVDAEQQGKEIRDTPVEELGT